MITNPKNITKYNKLLKQREIINFKISNMEQADLLDQILNFSSNKDISEFIKPINTKFTEKEIKDILDCFLSKKS